MKLLRVTLLALSLGTIAAVSLAVWSPTEGASPAYACDTATGEDCD